MIQDLEILSTGPDLAQQGLDAMQSRAMHQLIQHRLAHFTKGHDVAADDARSYHDMLAHVGRHFLQPMHDRTRGNPSAVELDGAATAATKCAALFLAFADKAHRDADRLRAAEAEAASAQQED